MGKLSALWAIVFIFAAIWFSKEIGWLPYTFDFPWIPAILLVFSLAIVINRLARR